MTNGGVTRRSLLGATAGAFAASALRPVGALAALTDTGPPQLREQWVGDLPRGETTIALDGIADLVGISWSQGQSGLMLRVPGHSGGLSPWVSAAACAAHGGSATTGAGVAGDPIWTGGVRSIELRTTEPLGGVRIYQVDASGGMGAHRRALAFGAFASEASLPLAAPVLEAGPGQPPIIARRAWAGTGSRPAVAPEYGSVKLAFVHHTDNPNGYGPAEVPPMLRAIYVFHRYVNGWNDIGYNFVVDLFGRIFEARAGGIDEPVTGAQAGGYNYVSTGVAMLGTFSARAISAAARRSLERLLAWKLALHGVPAVGTVNVRVDPAGAFYSRYPAGARVTLPRVAGHRDADTTECPGTVLYDELPAMRPRIGHLQGSLARATLSLATASATEAGAPTPAATAAPAPAKATLAGELIGLDGAPLGGVSVLVQERSVERKGEVVRERTVAQATTTALGEWALPVEVAKRRGGAALRVLAAVVPSGRAGAVTVSEPLRVAGAVTAVQPSQAAPAGSTPAPESAPAVAARAAARQSS